MVTTPIMGVTAAMTPLAHEQQHDSRHALPDRTALRDGAVRDTLAVVPAAVPGAGGVRRAADALALAYDVTWDHTAPVVMSAAARMLPDLYADTEDPRCTVVFLGRDGFVLGSAVQALDPRLVARRSVDLLAPRVAFEAAVADRERSGETFPAVHDFRMPGRVARHEVPGAAQHLEEHLIDSGVPLRPGAALTLVDTSYKGSTQELLAALRPDLDLRGRYLAHGASPHDPHPGSKTGYLLHLEADRSSGGRPVRDLPPDPRLTLSWQEAIGTLEETLGGPLAGSAPSSRGRRHRPDGVMPVGALLRGLHPGRVARPYRDPAVREAVKRVTRVAVADHARWIVAVQRDSGAARELLDAGLVRHRNAVRAWSERGLGPLATNRPDALRSRGSAAFELVMDSFVRRSDRREVARLTDALRRRGVPESRAAELWREYDRRDGPAARRALADEVDRDR